LKKKYYIFGIIIVFLMINAKNVVCSSRYNIPRLVSYSVKYKGEGYDLNLLFKNGYLEANSIITIKCAGLDFIPSIFNINFIGNEYRNLSSYCNTSQTYGTIYIDIFSKIGHKCYDYSYKIILLPEVYESEPPIVNITEYIDITVNVENNNNITFIFPDSNFKLLVLGASIFTAAALYIKTETSTTGIQKPKDKKLKRIERDRHGKFYSLSSAIIAYYMFNKYEYAPFNFTYGYEIASLLLAGFIYFAIRGIYSSKGIAIKRFMYSIMLLSIFGIFYKNIIALISLIIAISVIIIMFILQNKQYKSTSKKFRKEDFL